MAAVGTIAGGAEVIDSRYRNFRFRAGHVIADNASSGAYVVIDRTVTTAEIDLIAQKVEVDCVDGNLQYSGTGEDVQGHPGEALALAAN